jgi:hypothetical protein
MPKRKAIEVKYRKTSESFPDYLKYEVTILNEDGTTDVVPAYGKDLQDALSRLVHDEKVEKVEKVAKKVPNYVWLAIWFIYLTLINSWFEHSNHNPIILLGGAIFAFIGVGFYIYWSKPKNKA